jgi:Tfp pilus assembly protein PilP
MTSRIATVYGIGGVLLVACLAAANMPQDVDGVAPRAPRAPRPAGPDALAKEVSVQATRLHARMSQAPIPGANTRNPFAFNVTHPTRPESALVHAAAVDEPAPEFVAPLPPLTLMGVAEDATAAGPKRTAIIGGDADTLYMVREGDTVGERYRVTKIGADAVELEDVLTKGYRRLALR